MITRHFPEIGYSITGEIRQNPGFPPHMEMKAYLMTQQEPPYKWNSVFGSTVDLPTALPVISATAFTSGELRVDKFCTEARFWIFDNEAAAQNFGTLIAGLYSIADEVLTELEAAR